MDLSTRALFPQNYEELKQRMIAEYSPLMTMKPHVVMKIIRVEDTRRFGEASFKAELDPLSKIFTFFQERSHSRRLVSMRPVLRLMR